MKTQLTTVKIGTELTECYVWNAKLYLTKEIGEWTDKTPFLEITFRDRIEHGVIKLKIKLASYLTNEDENVNLNEVRFTQDEFNYQIDIRTGQRILNTLKTDEIELLVSKIFYSLGINEGIEAGVDDLVGKSALLTLDKGRIINIKKTVR